MFINPIDRIGSIEEIKGVSGMPSARQVNGGESFQNIFSSMINDVKQTEADLVQNQYLLSTGQINDPHTVPIAAAKAQVSVDLLVQMRNKALESYNELMRINL